MTFLTLSMAALALASPSLTCPPPSDHPPERRVFTNDDLDRMKPCRYQTGALSDVGTPPTDRPPAPKGRAGRKGATPDPGLATATAEADWRAQWRSVDQKARRLRQEAHQLRQEASEASRDPKKRPTGRRSPSLLTTRAAALEAEARELQDDFQERARRAGALPGWLRPKAR